MIKDLGSKRSSFSKQKKNQVLALASSAERCVSATYDNVKNLAFGRPPVCILRVGDFFHTKIIIESMSITYKKDAIMWDLNPEGIGVQPMYADISLNIKIL